ncbi:MAG: DUF1553 domain-containing protein [Verrucomicrobiales bacterium]
MDAMSGLTNVARNGTPCAEPEEMSLECAGSTALFFRTHTTLTKKLRRAGALQIGGFKARAPLTECHFVLRSVAIFFCLLTLSFDCIADEPLSFRRDVLPVLSKANCNGGGCHGALAGKGGFRLSLFGYNPEADWMHITRESKGRRIDLGNPGASLLLTKPTTALKHKGGKRFGVDTEEYRILSQWIAAGAAAPSADDPKLQELTITPPERILANGASVQLTVTAGYSDGVRRDVTRWAKFTSTDATVAEVDESGKVTVVGHGEGAITAWFSSQIVTARVTVPYPFEIPAERYADARRVNFVDDRVLEQLQRLHLEPSLDSDNATFVRRVFIDLIGRLPTPDEVQGFDGNRAALVDRLLAMPEYVDFWTYKWSDVLLVSGSLLRPDAVKAYYGWIRERVANNTPWDDFARQLITAKGDSLEQGATNFFAVHQDPETMAENVSKAFLSLSINCAKCHNHPLEKWTNDQYYSFANLFARVRTKGWGGDPRGGDGKRTLFVLDQGDLIQPRTGKPQPPAPLDAPAIDEDDPTERRQVLAHWLTDPENPYFAKAITNRVWAHFMGVGLVEPVDDLRASNPPSNERLLSELADFLKESNFDLRSLIRVVANSAAYQRSAHPLPSNEGESRYYARFYPRRLMAEVLSDAISDVTKVSDSFVEIALNDGSSEKTEAYTTGTRAVQLQDSAVRSYFLSTFGRNQRDITCECERSNQPSLVQSLHLSNGSTINGKLAAKDGRVAALLAENRPLPELIDRIYLLCVSRPASDDERNRLEKLFTDAPESERRELAEDLFWSLLTSREFLFQH